MTREICLRTGIKAMLTDGVVQSIYTGFKDPNANVPGTHFVALDTWQKQSRKWKLQGAAVSTEPTPAEAYRMPAPGSN